MAYTVYDKSGKKRTTVNKAVYDAWRGAGYSTSPPKEEVTPKAPTNRTSRVQESVKLWNPSENRYATVGSGRVEDYLSRGYTKELPTQSQIKDVEKSAVAGKQKYINPKVGVTDIKPVMPTAPESTKAPVMPTTTPVDTSKARMDIQKQALADTESLRNQIAEKSKQSAIDRFKSALSKATGVLKQEQTQTDIAEREQIAGARTTGAMESAAMDKRLEGLGLSGSGSMAQSALGQSVATQGRESAIRQSAESARQDIQRRISEAQIEAEQGIAEAETEADVAALQNALETQLATYQYQLDEIERAEAAATAGEAQAKADYLGTIGRFTQDFQAEINRLQNDGDPTNDWQIPYLQAARQEKISAQNLDPITGQPLQKGIQYTVPQALEAYRMGIYSPEVLQTLGAAGYQVSGGAGGGAMGGTTTTPTYVPPTPTASKEVNFGNLASNLDQMAARGASSDDILQYMTNNADSLISQYGKDAVNAMYSQIQENQQGMGTEINDMKADGLTSQEIYDTIISNRASFNQVYGPTVVNDYLKMVSAGR